MNKKFKTKELVILGLLVAIVLIMSTTPLGTLPIGPLSITLNMIPVAIAAITLGPVGGCIVGCVFGLFSFCQALGLFVPSGMGALTFAYSPILTFVQRVVSRGLVGLLLGFIFRGTRKIVHTNVACFVTGFCAALLNYIFFMGMLVLFFSNLETIASAWITKGVWAYLVATFLSNTIFELIASTLLTGIIGVGLYKAKLLSSVSSK
ncbi:MAG: ECF transporter S component [Lachnospiraceae bacterium]